MAYINLLTYNTTNFKCLFLKMFSADCMWDGWGKWTPCSTTCGIGNKVRTRTILSDESNEDCVGPTHQLQSCADKPCENNPSE